MPRQILKRITNEFTATWINILFTWILFFFFYLSRVAFNYFIHLMILKYQNISHLILFKF